MRISIQINYLEIQRTRAEREKQKKTSINRHSASTNNFAQTLQTHLCGQKHNRTMKISFNSDYLELQCTHVEQDWHLINGESWGSKVVWLYKLS